MHLMDENDLIELILDEAIFSLFPLSEREKQILHMHLLKGFSFEFIGGVLTISGSRAHQVYKQSLQKIRQTIFELLRFVAELFYPST